MFRPLFTRSPLVMMYEKCHSLVPVPLVYTIFFARSEIVATRYGINVLLFKKQVSEKIIFAVIVSPVVYVFAGGGITSNTVGAVLSGMVSALPINCCSAMPSSFPTSSLSCHFKISCSPGFHCKLKSVSFFCC